MTQYALCLGVNDYSVQRQSGLWSTCDDLPYSVQDAQDFKQLLIDALNFDANNIQLQTDSWCTRENILDTINGLLSNAQAGDVVCVFYGGHGARLPGNTPSAPPNAKVWYEALVPYSGVLTDYDLAQTIGKLEYSKVNLTFVLASCHSGGMDPIQGGPQPIGTELNLGQDQDVNQALAQNCQTLTPFGLCLPDPAGALGENVSISTQNGQVSINEPDASRYVDLAKDTLLSACAADQVGWQVPALQGSILVAAMKSVVNMSNFQMSYSDLLARVRSEADSLMTKYIRTDPKHANDLSTPELYGQRARMSENFLTPWSFSIQG